jgi:hypothetical protein
LHVHALEQASLLRAASSLRTVNACRGQASRIPAPRSTGERLGSRTVAGWRALALEAVHVARQDDATIHPVLARLVRAPVAVWPSATAIASAALEVAWNHAGFVALARAELGEGRFEEAFAILHHVLLDDPQEDLRLEALGCAAFGLELTGDLEGALATYEAALATRGGDLRQAVPLLALALCAGDDARASVASDRLHGLDLGIPGVRSRFHAALAEMRKRLAWRRGLDVHASATRALGVRRFLARNRGPEAAVAEVVLLG